MLIDLPISDLLLLGAYLIGTAGYLLKLFL